jgi:pimeloyl-ACP methyl ester carboxylesterase
MSTDHTVPIPGGSLYYRTQGRGSPLVLIGGGPSNADTLSAVADQLDRDYTVVSYDRRGYSRSQLDDREAPVSIGQHADDVRLIIKDLNMGPAVVFGTSIGALIALELAAAAPGAVGPLVGHEPPLGQLLTGDDRATFDDGGTGSDAGAALDALARSTGVRRGAQAGSGGAGDKARAGDIELLIRRDIPAVGQYHLDLDRLAPMAGRIVVAAGRDSREFYPYRCAARLAEGLGLPLAELPGNHAGMIQHPAEFAAALERLLKSAELSPGLGHGAQPSGNLVHRVQGASGHVDDQVVSLIVGKCQPTSVDTIEGDRRGQRQALVTVDQRMVTGQRMQ